MTRTKSLFVAGLVLASFAIAASSRAANIGHLEYWTISHAMSLPGVVLAPGTYEFQVVQGHADLVRVTDRATNRVLYLGFTDVIRRPAGKTDRGSLAFGEAPKGQPVPIQAWFPSGSRSGNGFRHR
jgi:hypothetical protein